jgi:nitroreductase
MVSTNFNPTNPETYELLMKRRSVKANDMLAPGPDHETITKILAAGMRVPDHGKLAPWRFIVLEGEAREKLGDVFADLAVTEYDANEQLVQKAKGYATQGPTLIIAISSPSTKHPIPEWEQHLSAGAACQNMLVAATALGLASQWLTGGGSYSPKVCKALGMTEKEKIAGLMFFGQHGERAPTERPRPNIDDHIIWGWPSDAAE